MTKKTFISLLYVLMCTVCFGQEFVHPGMLHTTSDLEFMKAKILAGEEPWKEAWNQLKDSEIASLRYKPTQFKFVDNGQYNQPPYLSQTYTKYNNHLQHSIPQY